MLIAPTGRPVPPNGVALAYYKQALGLIKQHHRKSSKADWAMIEPRARALLAAAKQPSDTYRAIRFLLASLNEPHSFLAEPESSSGEKPNRQSEATAGPMPTATLPMSRLVENKFGYLYLPGLNTLGSDGPALGLRYSSTLRTALLDMDKHNLCGFIVDLRGNNGGNMWPMLQGLDPLLGGPPFGYFVLPDRTKQEWTRRAGNIVYSAVSTGATSPTFSLRHASAPLAVLIGSQTASSGEMAAIAFIGRANTRIFGSPSAGFTSANKVYRLSDGAALALTETAVQDRFGKEYVGPIVPDEQVDGSDLESVVNNWLSSQCTKATTGENSK
ncbi:S41 family peptidase [Sphingomonas sp. RRHST34]|uniref:S41 family peptidase n=1 Tax=Sphingomonas citri TaxID=2862499 RepID=A0ABS7BSR2_9SPHN|nr:S41 family peptidase [Sphingomonas citri]MBW6532616.1 S41 family peptidase [Sphingomonas citri]